MSANNGDKSRFHRLRKAKLARRKEAVEAKQKKVTAAAEPTPKGENS